MHCPLCHRLNSANAAFCSACGTQLAGSTPPPASEPVATALRESGRPWLWPALSGIAVGTMATAATIGGVIYVTRQPDPGPTTPIAQVAQPSLPRQPSPAASESGSPATDSLNPPVPVAPPAKAPTPIAAPRATSPSVPAPQQAAAPPPAAPLLDPPQSFTPLPPPQTPSIMAPPPVPPSPPVLVEETLPPLPWSAPPELYVLPSETSYVYMVVTLVGVYCVGGEWYRHHHGHWYRSHAHDGRWHRISRVYVPFAVLDTPPEYPRHLSPHYRRIAYDDFKRHWRNWEQQRHWNHYDWYRHEARPDVRAERRRVIGEGRRPEPPAPPATLATPAPSLHKNVTAPVPAIAAPAATPPVATRVASTPTPAAPTPVATPPLTAPTQAATPGTAPTTTAPQKPERHERFGRPTDREADHPPRIAAPPGVEPPARPRPTVLPPAPIQNVPERAAPAVQPARPPSLPAQPPGGQAAGMPPAAAGVSIPAPPPPSRPPPSVTPAVAAPPPREPLASPPPAPTPAPPAFARDAHRRIAPATPPVADPGRHEATPAAPVREMPVHRPAAPVQETRPPAASEHPPGRPEGGCRGNDLQCFTNAQGKRPPAAIK